MHAEDHPDVLMVRRAGPVQRLVHAIAAFLNSYRRATVDEILMQQRHDAEVQQLRRQYDSALATVGDREHEIQTLKQELAESQSTVKILQLEVNALAKTWERTLARVDADTAEQAARRAKAEIGKVRPHHQEQPLH